MFARWKYYLPYLFILVSITGFVQFLWLPRYIALELETITTQEKLQLELLAESLIPALLASDLSEIEITLDEVSSKRTTWEQVKLVAANGYRLYPINDPEVIASEASTLLVNTVVHDDRQLGELQLYVNIQDAIEDGIKEIKYLGSMLLFSIGILTVIALYLQHRLLSKPLQRLTMATTRIAQGDYEEELPIVKDPALSEFVTTFDQMRTILKSRNLKIARQEEIQSTVHLIQTHYITADDQNAVFGSMLDNIIKLTDSQFGFIGEVLYDRDGQPYLKSYAISNIAWDVQSRHLYEKSLDEGLTFTNTNTLFGRVLVTGQPHISNDPSTDPNSGGVPEGHPSLDSFIGIPIYNRKDRLMGMVGLANAEDGYDENVIEELKILWLAIGNLIDAYREKQLLVDSEEGNRAILENAVEGIITIDRNGTVLSYNPAAEQIFGYEPNEVINNNISMLMPSRYAGEHDAYLSRYAGGGRAKIIGVGREVEGLRKNGEEFPMELSVTTVKTGKTTRYTGIIRDITERKNHEHELQTAKDELAEANVQLLAMSRHDGLTEIANRRHFDEVLSQEMRRAMRNSEPLSLILFDVDHFKKYNDKYGHSDGDRCLQMIAKTTQGIFRRAGDLVARYGGEEFAVILPSVDLAVAAKLAETIRESVENLVIPHAASQTAEHVTVSLGVAAIVNEQDAEPELLIRMADGALYNAKARGRNRVCTPSESGDPEQVSA